MNFSISAAVTLELLSHRVEVARHHLPQRLGVERLAEARRALEVGEDDRHDLPHLLRRACLGELRATGEAEPRDVRVLDAARRTELHASESTNPARVPGRPATMVAMAAAPADALLAHAAELERRDDGDRRGARDRAPPGRARGGRPRRGLERCGEGLERLPLELEEVERRRRRRRDRCRQLRAPSSTASGVIASPGIEWRQPAPRRRARSRAQGGADGRGEALADTLARAESGSTSGGGAAGRRGRSCTAEVEELARGRGEGRGRPAPPRAARGRAPAATPGTTLEELDDWGGPGAVGAVRRPRHARVGAGAGRRRGERPRWRPSWASSSGHPGVALVRRPARGALRV